tara:strand:+ start:518 stop:1342 length:825 start_codon:yes stop_codon:yes gene_type:complete
MLELIEKHRCYNGYQTVYEHQSETNNCKMRFGLYIPDKEQNIPILFFLSGITCTEQNFIQKSGFQKFASDNQIAVVVPDTSPRGEDIPDSSDWKLGKGAGFYLNAITTQWSKNYNMYDYICKELIEIIRNNFNFNKSKIGIFGHSMGGGGAIQCAIKNKELFKSISAFSPICSLSKSSFASLAIKEYLNNNSETINLYDPLYLIENSESIEKIKIDVGLNDEFLDDLYLNDFEKVCSKNNQKLFVNKHHGYDHGYYFIQSFIKDHFEFHSSNLL